MFPEICWKAVQNVLELTPRCLNKLFLYCNSFAFWPTTHIVFLIWIHFLQFQFDILLTLQHGYIILHTCTYMWTTVILKFFQSTRVFTPFVLYIHIYMLYIYIYNPFVWQILDQFELGLQFTRTAGKLKFWRSIVLKQCRCTCRQWCCYVVVVIVAYMVISIILGLWAQMLHVCKKKMYMDGYFYPIFFKS